MKGRPKIKQIGGSQKLYSAKTDTSKTNNNALTNENYSPKANIYTSAEHSDMSVLLSRQLNHLSAP
jgi:hypothetical protein